MLLNSNSQKPKCKFYPSLVCGISCFFTSLIYVILLVDELLLYLCMWPNFTVVCGSLWYFAVFCGILRYFAVFCGILR